MNSEKTQSKIQYTLEKVEFHGLCITATKEAQRYKLFISPTLLAENNLDFWNFHDRTYYENFINENISSFLKGIDIGFYRQYSDGNFIDKKANFI